MSEFKELGYQDASLRSIAYKADVTVGAIHTRWKAKDDLFAACVEPVFTHLRIEYERIQEQYAHPIEEGVDPFSYVMEAIRAEADVIINVIYEHYDESYLLLCRSNGSSLENFVYDMVSMKTGSSAEFLRSAGIKVVDETFLRVVVALLLEGLVTIFRTCSTAEEAKRYMGLLAVFNEEGIEAVYQRLVDGSY